MPDSKKLPSRLSRSPRLIVALGLFGVSGWLLADRNHIEQPGKDSPGNAPLGVNLPAPGTDARESKVGPSDSKP